MAKPTPRRHRAAAAVLAASLLGLTGCSGATEGGAPATSSPSVDDPTETSTSPSTEAPAPTPSETGGPESSYAGVEPAAGELVELDGFSLRVPESYELDEPGSPVTFDASRRDDISGIDYIGGFATPNYGQQDSLSKLLRDHNRTDITYSRNPVTRGPVVVDGVRMYHASGMINPFVWGEAFGTGFTDFDVDITFTFSKRVPKAEREEVVDSVMASLKLT